MLSEKPVAENVKDAEELIKWYHSEIDSSKATWAVAENFRYLNSFDYAQELTQKLGKLLTFRVRMQTLVEGGKYFGLSLSAPPFPTSVSPFPFISNLLIPLCESEIQRVHPISIYGLNSALVL